MTDEVERLYERARQLPPDARAAFVDEACRGDPALREELASLLAHADAAERFFDRLGGAVRAAVPALDRSAVRHLAGDDPSAASSPTSPTLPDPGAARDPMLGRTIGRYHVLSLLGRGGMGAVYRAHDERLARDVALKFLPPYVADDPDAARRFVVEARAAAALAHPNVCTVHEIGEAEDGRPFIAMALYEGETLKERLRRGPLPPREAAAIARALASALGAAHARGIVHRDVKPGNVMLARDGLARLLDFGLAQVGDASLTGKGATPGTIAYMSPEQARGDPLDHRSDLWSLGVVLHEMLAGARPFRGGNDRAVLQAILHDPPEPLAARAPATPRALVRIVERLLRKAPEKRYADAAAVEADLAAALATPLDGAAAMTPGARSARWRRGAAGAVVGVAVVVAAVAAARPLVGWWRRAKPPLTAAGTAAATPAARSLAVLPFVDMSGDPANRYFSDGLSEEITTALGRIEGLRVAARSSAFALRDRGLDARWIADTLGVDAVLEGSVRRAGRRLRVTAQLVDAHTGLRVWSDEYDREVEDVLVVQDDIARAIAGALALRLPTRGAAARAPRATNFAAYDLYLRARQLRSDMGRDPLRQATELLDSAIALDPDFALAWAAKATVVAPRVFFGLVPPDSGLREVRAAIDRAFALDPDLGEAHVAKGMVQLFWERDWAGAERSLRRAIALNPSDAHAWHHLANYYGAMARPNEATAARQRGLVLDPLDARLYFANGQEYLVAGRLSEARAAFERGVRLDPRHPISLGLGPSPPRGPWSVDLAQGRDAEAVRALLQVAALLGASRDDVESLRRAFATGGIHAFWRRWLVLDRRKNGAAIDPLRVAALGAMSGDTAQALDALERAWAQQAPGLIFMRTEPAFAPLRTSPRYLRVERLMHFPPRPER